MRDERDPGTAEMHLPRKQGRPPKNGVAMTDAERAKAYRQARKTRTMQVAYNFKAADDLALLDRLRMAITAEHDDTAALIIQELGRRYK